MKKISILALFLLAVVFVSGCSNKQQKERTSQNQNTEQVSQKTQDDNQNKRDLVWYEIPELNIKFQIEKEIADVLEYRDFYVEGYEIDGKELYIKDSDIFKSNAFATLKISKASIGEYQSKYSNKKTKWDEMCLSDNIVFKDEKQIICYTKTYHLVEMEKSKERYDKLGSQTKKILKDYLKNVPVKKIN